MKNNFPNSGILSRKEKSKVFYIFPEYNGRRINVNFQFPVGNISTIAPANIRVKDLLLAFGNKMGLSPKVLENQIFFIHHGCKININEEQDLISYANNKTNISIIVIDSKNLIGGNSNF